MPVLTKMRLPGCFSKLHGWVEDTVCFGVGLGEIILRAVYLVFPLVLWIAYTVLDEYLVYEVLQLDLPPIFTVGMGMYELYWLWWKSYAMFGCGPKNIPADVRRIMASCKDKQGALKFVHISDTHGCHRDLELPPGDVLVHTGDFTNTGELDTIVDLNKWFGELPFKHIIVIPGNHDLSFDKKLYDKTWRDWHDQKVVDPETLFTNAIYLPEGSITICGIKITSFAPTRAILGHTMAFNPSDAVRRRMAEELATVTDTDILVSHGPPMMIRDGFFGQSLPVGCPYLLDAIRKIRPRYHLFGHLHSGYGALESEGTVFLNGASVNLFRQACHDPMVFYFEGKTTTRPGSEYVY